VHTRIIKAHLQQDQAIKVVFGSSPNARSREDTLTDRRRDRSLAAQRVRHGRRRHASLPGDVSD
jgi:hypothetical protein